MHACQNYGQSVGPSNLITLLFLSIELHPLHFWYGFLVFSTELTQHSIGFDILQLCIPGILYV